MEQVDRVAAWSAARQRTWSEYYQYVQSYLRNVVRLDPNRAGCQRLRDQLATFLDHPFGLVVADAPFIRLIREFEACRERPPVTRPRQDREPPLEDLTAAPSSVTLETHVRQAGSRIAGAAHCRADGGTADFPRKFPATDVPGRPLSALASLPCVHCQTDRAGSRRYAAAFPFFGKHSAPSCPLRPRHPFLLDPRASGSSVVPWSSSGIRSESSCEAASGTGTSSITGWGRGAR